MSSKVIVYSAKNKTITMLENEESLLAHLRGLRPRKDKLNPMLRKSLLNNSLSEAAYRKKLDKIISSKL